MGGDTIISKVELSENVDLHAVIEVLTQNLMHNSVQTKVAVLRWVLHLYIKIPVLVIVKHFAYCYMNMYGNRLFYPLDVWTYR